MIAGSQPFIPFLGNKLSTVTGGDQQFYGGKPPFMAAVLPQAWYTLYGITDTDIHQAPIPQPILFALHGLRLTQKSMFLPSKAMLPQVYQWGWADNTLAGITGSDVFRSPRPQPLLFMLADLRLSQRGIFHPAKSILASEGVAIDGKTDSDIKQPGMPKPVLFALGLGKQRVFHPLTVQPEVPDATATWKIEGITKDKVGNPVACSTVYLFNVTSGIPVLVKTATSDGSGLYSFTVEEGQIYWVTDYKTGTPDKTGATLNTLTGGTLVDVFAYDPLDPSKGGIMMHPGMGGGING